MTLRVRVLLLVLAIAVFGGVASRVRISTSLAEALPADGEVGRAFRDIQRFALLDTLLVEVDGTGHTEAELHAAVDALGARLAARDDFLSVRYRFGLEDGLHLREAAEPSRIALAPLPLLSHRLGDAGMREVLLRARGRMSGPAGSMIVRQLTDDPLDLGQAFTDRVIRLGADAGTVARGGHLLAADGQHALILARAVAPALGTTRDAPLVRHLEADLAASPLPADWLGSHRFAAEAAEQITREVNLAVTAGLVLVCAVFLVAFRSVRPLLAALPAVVTGTAAGAAAAALCSPIHGLALAFGGALTGMGVDYWIHLYLMGIRDGVPSTVAERLGVAERALRALLPAYAISVSATVGAFAMLATSSYQAVSDLGVIGIGAALGALLSVVLGGPVAFALFARPGDRLPQIPLPVHPPRWVGWTVAAGMLVLGALGTRVSFDGDPRALDARLPETAALEAEIRGRYGGEATTGLVVADGPDLDAALTRLGPALAALSHVADLSLTDPTLFVPPAAEVAARRALVADRRAIEARFSAAAERAGFDAAVLLPGLRRTLDATAAPTLATWGGTPAAEILARTVSVDAEGAHVAVVVAALTPEALAAAMAAVGSAGGDGVRFVYPAGVGKLGAERIANEVTSRAGLALLAVVVFMTLRYRDPRKILAASLPSLAAACGTLGLLAVTGLPLTPVSGPALVLVLGVAFDQGIFLVEAQDTDDSGFLASRAAILVALATALAGFVGLCLADHPAVFGVGAVVSTGIVSTAVAAFGLNLKGITSG